MISGRMTRDYRDRERSAFRHCCRLQRRDDNYVSPHRATFYGSVRREGPATRFADRPACRTLHNLVVMSLSADKNVARRPSDVEPRVRILQAKPRIRHRREGWRLAPLLHARQTRVLVHSSVPRPCRRVPARLADDRSRHGAPCVVRVVRSSAEPWLDVGSLVAERRREPRPGSGRPRAPDRSGTDGTPSTGHIALADVDAGAPFERDPGQ